MGFHDHVGSIPYRAPEPVAIREVLLVSHTHHDVGYTNSPRLMDTAHVDIVGHVLDLIEATPDAGPEAFRWTFEVARPVLEFVRKHGDEGLARLTATVAAGRACVTAGHLNFTQLLATPEQDAAYLALGTLRDAGIPIRTQQHGDVNGLSWGANVAMRRHGVDRLVMALNPDHGHPPLPQPAAFWWEGPDGGRVFTFLSTHYGYGEPWGLLDGLVDEAVAEIERFVTELSAAPQWPFDVAVVHAANDNRWPDLDYLAVARAWNQRHPDQPLRTVTVDEAVDRLVESPAAAELPVLRGEWSDWWAHGHGSTAREVAVYRESLTHLAAARWTHSLALLRGPGATDLGTVLGFNRGPVRHRSPDELAEGVREAEAAALLAAEHTWGSWDTHENVRGFNAAHQANAKASWVWRGWELARSLATEGFFRAVADRRDAAAGPAHHPVGKGSDTTVARGDRVVVLNPTPRERTEAVRLRVDNGLRESLHRVTVPGFGQTTFTVDRSDPEVRDGDTVETGFYTVRLDPTRGGVVSIIDRATGTDLLDNGPHGLGALLQERLDGGDPDLVGAPAAASLAEDPGATLRRLADSMGPGSAARPSRTVVTATASGGTVLRRPGQVALRWTQDATLVSGTPAQRAALPLAVRVTCTLTSYDEDPALDLDVEVDKPEVPLVESLHVAFPFAVEGVPEFVLETEGAAFIAGVEQLPSSCHAWYSVQHALGVRPRGATRGVVLTTPDAPLVQLGGVHTDHWLDDTRPHPSSGLVTSWIMNNWYGTNFRAHQGGYHRFRYRLLPGEVTHASVRRAGDDSARPLVVRQYGGHVHDPGPELALDPPDAALVDIRPDFEAGSVRMTLHPLGDPGSLRISWGDQHLDVDPARGHDIHLLRTGTGVELTDRGVG